MWVVLTGSVLLTVCEGSFNCVGVLLTVCVGVLLTVCVGVLLIV